jgi:hypothetical protein
LHKLLAKTEIFSARVNSNTQRSNANFINFTPNFKCHSTAKLCALTFYTFSPLGDFEVLKHKFEERGKVLSAHIDKVMT